MTYQNLLYLLLAALGADAENIPRPESLSSSIPRS